MCRFRDIYPCLMSPENTELSAAQLLDILALSPNATAVYTTESLLIQTANDAMIGFWGKDRSIIGLPLEQAVPELHGQPFIGFLKEVWNNATTYQDRDAPAKLRVEGKLQTFYFDFTYRALLNDEGEIYCILHTAEDVTERYLHGLALADLENGKLIYNGSKNNLMRNYQMLMLN